MVDEGPSNSTTNIALFIIQIVSAASGFIIAASCLFLRKWHPPVAYMAAFNISFWIGVQAMITHSASAISVRLPDSSIEIQQSKPLVRYLVWAQFAMPLWFVFLNATIATDLLMSQLIRVNAVRLQALHKWYLPVATAMAFVLALPLLIYHSEYQPRANVFSVQFPSALSVTLYYILAFDLWIAIGILYCFVVISLVVGTIVIKQRRKRAAWRRQNLAMLESAWTSQLPTEENKSNPLAAVTAANKIQVVGGTDTRNDTGNKSQLLILQQGSSKIDSEHQNNSSVVANNNNMFIDCSQVSTFSKDLPSQEQQSINSPRSTNHQPPSATEEPGNQEQISMNPDSGSGASGADIASKPSDTLMSGITIGQNYTIRLSNTTDSEISVVGSVDKNTNQSAVHTDSSISNSGHEPNQSKHATDSCNSSPAFEKVRFSISGGGGSPSSSKDTSESSMVLSSIPTKEEDKRQTNGNNTPKPHLTLSNLPSFLTLRSSNRSTITLHTSNAPFRISTLPLVRLLLYPLIPIFSFTLMCVVRWVWFRSAMPSRWEVLNVVSGILRALEGFLCLIVFLLNPALNRSFREIRKRNTPVFAQ